MKKHNHNDIPFPGKSLSLLVLGLCSSLACAQAADDQTDQTQTITVTASRGTQLANMDMSTTVISRKEIQRAPENTVDQILNKIPGIFLPEQPTNQLHPTGQVLSIRGFGTSTNGLTLVLLDGVPINDPYFRTVNWGQIPKDSIERIEIIRGGGATSLWGNMAMGGVINIVTRKPVDGEQRAEISYGSFHTITAGGSLGFTPTPELIIGLTVDRTQTDGYNQTPSQYRNPYMDATASVMNNVTASAFYTPNQTAKYYVRLQASQTNENGLTYSIANNQWNSYRLSAGGAIELSDHTSVNMTAWYQSSAMDTTNASNASYTLATPTAGIPYISQVEDATYHTFGSSVYVQSEWGAIKDIKAGLDYRTVSTNDPLNIYNTTGYLGDIVSGATHQFEGVFVQGSYRPTSIPLNLTLGLREDFWQADNAGINGNYKGSVIDSSLSNQSYSRFDPRLGVKYDVNDAFDLRAATYRNFSAPGLNQMYRSFVSGSNYTIPDTNLVPQTNNGEEIGFDYKKQDFKVAVTAYDNHLRNYIDYSTVQSGCVAANAYCGTNVSSASTIKQYVNAGDATFRGFEVLGEWHVLDSLKLNGGFSKTDAYLTSSKVATDPTGQQLGQVPVWMLNAGATWSPSSQFSYTLQIKDFPNYWNTTSHTQVNQGALIADVGMIYKPTKKIDIFALAQNIGGRSYYDQGLSYTATGAINTSSSGTTPALGMPFNLTVGMRIAF